MKTEEFFEPERYELHEGPRYHFELSRRQFVAGLGAGLILCVAVPSVQGQRSRRGGGGGETESPLDQRLHLGTNGVVTVLTSKVEVGQGSRTQLTQAAAEELRLPMERVQLVMGDTAGPDDGGTAGSRTTPATVPTVRRACATARQLLVQAAASRFEMDASRLSVRDGHVEGLPSGKVFGYAEFAAPENDHALHAERRPGEVLLSDVGQWVTLGQPVARVGASSIVTGAHRYPCDTVRPGMLYGKILRSPSFGAKLTELNLEAARTLPETVVVRDGDFVGVAAVTTFAAEEALAALAKTARWQTVGHPSSDELFTYLRAKSSPSGRPDKKGSPAEALQAAAKVLRQTYQVAYIQHVPMEPRAAVAEWDGGALSVWTGSQQPARVRQDLAESLRISPERVRVIVPDTGGGFGGKHSGEVAVEAARLARDAKKPVSLRWTREEEFTWAYFRPAGVIDLAAGFDGKGECVAWEHVNLNSGASAIGTPYAIANTSTEFRNCDQPLRAGSYRGLAATANTFARESFMDELAGAVGADPLQFRLRYLSNERLRAVLTAATDRFDWAKRWTPNASARSTGVGLACGTEKGSFMACCVEIEVNPRDGTFQVVRIVEAFECGAIQNPANLKAQVEGAIIQGLGGALTEEVRFKAGQILNASLSRYRVPRLKDVPVIESILINRVDLPSVGAGETPIIGVAPAIANALFHATQVRIRSMPIRNEQFRVG